MSWAEEDWTVGLSGRVLQKVKELQVHQERLSRENKQKQLQLDNVNASLKKQTVKYEEVRGELHSVQRDLQSVREEAEAAVTGRERLTQELQTKQAQVCSLEGQLDAARTLGNKLTQEIKRLEAELEKLQNSTRPADITVFSTPCWNTTSPWENNGSKQEERSGQRDEGQSQANVRQRLQFSDMATASSPRQQQKSTPHRHPSDQSDIFSTPSAAFPWERDDSRPAARRRLPPSPQTPYTHVTNQGLPEQGGGGKEKNPKTEADTISLSEMRRRISALEDELSVKASTLKNVQNETVQSKKELAAKELNLQKTRDELSLARTRMAQDSERASGAEQRVKQLQEELKCQRQNAESSRLQHQQRTKELERQHQRDLTELQKERQCLERQHQQEVNKLNQELQQARTLHNTLKAQNDKLSLQKQALDKELDTTKEKLKWTEGQLKESQKKETQTQAKLTEAVREAEGVAVSLEQSRKKERALEEEGKRLTEELADALRLIKELQEQKSVPAAPLQPVQFCPVGQSFSPQSSLSHHPRPSAHSKRPASTRPEQRREEEEDVDARRAEITASYPPDREPGEGIDSEHITVINSSDSESLQRAGNKRKGNEGDIGSRKGFIDCDISGTSKSCSTHSAVSAPINSSVDGDKVIDPERSTLAQSSVLSAEKTCSLKSEQITPSEDLKRENAMLRSEIQDVRDELQKRLEDLETQRRAEAEARTRLKQLSRKHSSQTVEREEKDKELKAQLDSEKAEAERLRRTIGTLEAEMKRLKEERDKKEREEQQEEKNQAQEDRESEMIELTIQLKKQLAEVKSQLALEREERKREEEERNQITDTDSDAKMALSIKLAELEAEVEELKRRGKDDSQEEERFSSANSPLTYLTLHDDELNSNIVSCDGKLLSSPEQHLLFCQSTNQRNMLVSQATADIIQEKPTAIDAERSLLSDDIQEVASDPENSQQNYLGGSSPSDLAKEVEHLQTEKQKETERANQYQVKLEALQNQVTRQTQQLTMAFEKQSQHISGLLVELQEKESALLSQGEELLRCKQELDVLKTEKEEKSLAKDVEEESQRQQQQDEKLVEISEIHHEKECPTIHHTADSLADDDLNLQKDASQPKTKTQITETATPSSSEEDTEARRSGEQHPGSGDSNQTHSNHDSAFVNPDDQSHQNVGKADLAAEILALQQENKLLKQRLEDLAISDSRSPTLQTNGENREAPDKQSQDRGDAATSCLMEQKTHNVPNDVITEELQSLQEDVKRSEDEGQDLEKKDGTTQAEEDLDEVSEAHIDHLQQQVEALQMQVRALTEETQQQAEELLVWRLASQPAPTFDQVIQSTDARCETQEQTDQNQDQTVQEHSLGTQKNQGSITVIREDELFFSCSSNKLQARTLFSRLQNSNVVEPNTLHPSKKTAALQEYNQDTAKTDQESEKENQEINLLQRSDACPMQHKLKRDTELIQISSDKTAQQHKAKDPHKVSGPNLTNTEKPEAKTNPSRATSEMNTISNCPDSGVKLEMKDVSSQTEESLCPRGVTTVCANTQTEEEEENEEELVDSPPVSPIPLPEGTAAEDKVLFAGSFPIPADPARLAERIRRNRTQLSAAFDDTEYEPYGLPEVVMKGFADIPSGPSCPYIVRRGLLGTTVVPAANKDTGDEEGETD